MKKIFPFLLLLIVSCTKVSDVEMIIDPAKGLSSGLYHIALLVEVNSNFSSLLFDKTKAKVKDFQVRPYQILPENSSFFVIPTIVERSVGKSFDTSMSKMIANYIRMNHFGVVTESETTADYIVMARVLESPDRRFGGNDSTIQITILQKDETPVFYATVLVESVSDENFFYFPSKQARPVKYLTLRGFEELFKAGLPQAFMEG